MRARLRTAGRVAGALAVVGALVVPVVVQANPAGGPGQFSTTATGDLNSTIPNGTCRVRVSATGGGGGSPGYGGTGGRGGANATINATFDVLPLQPWAASVGGGGASTSTGGINGGGSSTAASGHAGAGGGGRTIVTIGGQQVVIAGGGGGGGGNHHSAPTGNGGNAGIVSAAGVGVGSNGTNGRDNPTTVTVGGGRGGQLAAGGAGGTNSANASLNGSAGGGIGSGNGGNAGPDPGWDGAGGGGAGYTGGGGGAATNASSSYSVTGGGGGGGSSYVASQSPIVTATAPTAISGSNGTSAASGSAGANGQVSLDWVPCIYDLSTTKSVSPNPVIAGQTATWTLTVTNNGPDAMTRGDTVTINDTLPGPGTQVVSVTTSGGSNANLTRGPVTCSGITVGSPMPASTDCSRAYSAVAGTPGSPTGGSRGLDPGESVTIVYTQAIPPSTAPTTYTNTASVQDRPSMTGTTDLVGTIVTDTAVRALTVEANADLRITKTASAPTVSAGGALTYTLLIENLGISDASSVTVTDPLPAGSTFTSASAGCTHSAGTVTCAVGALAAGASTTRTITIAAPTTAGTISNTATVSSSTTDPVSTNNSSSVDTTVVANADLGVTKTVDTATPAVNGNVTFTVTATNNGPQAATGVVVNDLLPAGLTFVSSTASVGTYNSATGVWTIGNLANAASATLSITATATSLTSVTNTATVSSPSVNDANATNDTASAAVDATDADLDVTKTVSDASPNLNGNVTYTISVHNNGADTATGVTVTDLLPSGLTYVSDTGSGAYVSSTGVWSAGSLTNGQTKTLQITAQVTSADPVTNTATITGSSQHDPVSSNNTSSVAVDARTADLAVTKSVSDVAPDVNGNVTYTVTVSNSGPDGATGVTVTDLLPSGATYVSDNGGGAYVSSSGVWTVGALANGASASLQITATITSPSVVTNTATVTSTSTDTNSANNSASVDVNARDANLAITKTVNTASPDLNGNVTYTVTVTNSGPDTAAAVSVNDLLPSGLTYVSDNGAGAYVSSTGVWTIGSMTSGASASLQITATVTTTSPVTNTATVASATTFDPATANNTASVVVDARAADLAITKSVSNATPDVNDNVVFTVSVTNNGPDAAVGVAVSDVLPSGLTYVSDNGSGAYVSSTGVWTIGALANGATTSLQITATVTVNTAVTNTATVGSTSTDPTSTNDSASATVDATEADLQITKSVSDLTPELGDTVTYTLTVTNNGPSSATNVVVHDLLPSGVTFLSASLAENGTDVLGQYWNVGTLASGASQTITVSARVDSVSAQTNTAVVSADQFDTNTANNTAQATTSAKQANLAVTKTVDTATPQVGANVTYTVTVTNSGPDAASAVVVNDLLPAGLTYVSDDGSGAYVSSTGVWTIGTLANGASRTLHITAMVTSPTPVTNTATVSSGTADPNTANNTASVAVDARDADLDVTKTVNDSAPNLNTNVTYTITVHNNGPDDTTGVAVTDPLPSGLTYVSDSGSGAYVSSTGVWSVGALTSGQTKTLQITATVTTLSAVTNTATITASSTYDAISSNNTSSVAVDAHASDLAITKTVDNATPDVNGNVTYTLTVTNNGPDAAHGVVVNDLLPAGATYVSDTASGGAYVSATGVWSVGTVPTGGTRTMQITATITSAGVVTNTATVTSEETDTVSSNDTASVDVNAKDANLAITKTVDNAAPGVNSNVTYTLTVTNDGPDTAVAVSVNDVLPSGLTYVSDTGSGAYVSSTGVWTIGALANGASTSLQITATVTSLSAITNTATVASATTNDPTMSNNTASVVVDAAAADLSVTKSVSSASPDVNGNVTYTVTVSNSGPDAATGVVVNDLLPSGATYVSDNGSGAYVSSTGVWTVGTLANGASASLQITATITTHTLVTNMATVTSTSTDTVSGNNSASVGVNAKDANLAITKSVNTASPDLNGNVTYTLTVTNSGPDTAAAVSVNDLLPSGLTYVSDNGSGAYVSSTGVWTIGSMTSGASASLQITATVTTTSPVTNTATVASATTFDPATANNTASVAVDARAADLAVTKSVDNATPDVNGNVTYTITVTNNGPDAATGVTVSDLLPTGATYVSDNGSGAYSTATGVWTIGALANGASISLQITATITTPNAVTNSATVTSTSTDPVSGNNTASAGVNAKDADLEIAKSVSDASANVGENVTYTVTVTNNGPDSATGIVVTDQLPSGVTYVSDDASGSYVSSTGAWSVGTLASGASATIHIVARVDVNTVVTNTASITASSVFDPTSSNNTDTATVDAPEADVRITKSVSDTTPNLGDTVTYTLVVSNAGPWSATNVVVHDLLPSGVTFLSASPAENGTDVLGQYWNVGTLASGASQTITVSARVDSVSAQTNTAVVSADQFDTNTANNTAQATTSAKQASLAVTKTVDTATPQVGANVVFTVTVTNSGPDAANAVVVNDLLPAGLTYVSDDASGAYVSSTGVWTIGTLANGASRTLHITATVTSPTPVTNTATVSSGTYDPTAGNNTASAAVNAKDADLDVTKTISDASPNLNDTVTYTISVHNNGPDDTTGVAVTDLLPTGLTYVSDTGSGAYVSATGVWTVGGLTSGQTKTLQITATVTSTAVVTNTATITASSLFDPTSSNNTSSVAVDARAADLAITKTINTATPDVNGNVTYTVTVTNNGPDAATGVAVSDLLPSGLTYVSDTGAGAYVSSTGAWTIGSMTSGASTALQITATVTTHSLLTNTASVTSTSTDTNSGNDTASVDVNAKDANLAITKSVSNATPDLNGNVTYTLTVTNNGPDTAASVTATDLLPSGLTYVSDTGAGAYVSSTGVWTIGSMTSGASTSLQITAKVTTTSSVTNTATVSSATTFDPASADNTASVVVDARASDLAITKTVNTATPDVNGNVVYTVTVTNNGPDTATGVTVNDLLPSGATYVSDTGAGTYFSATGVWTIGSLANGTSASLQITAKITTHTVVTNTAAVTSTSTDTDSANNSASVAVNAKDANLAITKTVNDATPDLNGNVTYTVTVTNNGPDAAASVTANDLLPSGLTYVSDSGAGAYVSSTGVWTIGSLANGASTSLQITARVTTTSPVTNTATVSSPTTFDPATADNTASVAVDARAADLVVTKTVDTATPDVNGNVTYTVTVTNNGPDAATGVVVNDLLPSGLTYVSDTGAGAYVSATGVWTIGTLANGAAISLQITATITTPTTVTNTATVTSTSTDTVSGNDSASVGVNAKDADLEVAKSVSNASANVGENVTYTVTVTNNGPDSATGITVTDQLPAGVTYVSDDASGSYVSSTGVWTVGTLASGASATLHIVARVDVNTAITNTASITASSVFDPASANNTDTATVDAPEADVRITKSVDDSTPELGQTVTFTLTATNAGPASATNVVVHDLLPAGLTFLSASPTETGTDALGQYWNVGTLASGASQTITVTARVDATTALTNAAVVDADQFDTNTANNSAHVTLSALQANLAVAKTVDNAAPQVGGNVVFTVTVTNNGPDAATDVRVTDLLPAGLSYVSDDAAGAYVSSTGMWTVGALANGASATLAVTATATDPAAVTNTATVSSGTYDPTAGDNTASVSVNAKDADLDVTKTISDASPNLNDTVTYTISVHNTGPDATTGVTVTDLLPAGLTYLSDTGAGAYASNTGVWAAGALSSGQTKTLQITARVTSLSVVTNTATITGSSVFDPTSSNDTSSVAVDARAADLAITKTVDTATPNVNGTVTYTLTVTNTGPDTATGVTVDDLLPAGATYVSDTGAGAYVSSTGVWTVGSLANGASASLQITATITSPTIVTNTATVSSTSTDTDTDDTTASVSVDAKDADLAITKTVSEAAPDLGGTVTYTLSVTNTGPDDTTGVTVTDLLPSGLTYVSDTGAGAYVPGTGVWSVGDLTDGQTKTVQITATVTTATAVTNTATVTGSSLFDPTAANDSDSVDVDARTADLQMTKTVNDATPDVNGNVVFTLTVTNTGPDTATGVTVDDLLPAGATYVSDTGAGAYVSSTGVWTVGSLANGASATLQITATITTPNAISNTATVSSTSTDTVQGNDSASAGVNATDADLAITKTVSDDSPNVGDTVTYTVEVTNNGPDDTTGVTVTDQLPSGLTYVADTGSGAYVSSTGVWTVGGLTSGQTKTLQITATVTTLSAVTNSAAITGSSQFDPTSTNDTSSVAIDARAADLAVTKTVDDTTPDVNGNVVFTLTVGNSGPDAATGVVVNDTLPSGLTYVSDDGAGAYNATTGNWTVGALANGATQTLHITARVDVDSQLTNTATVTSTSTDTTAANDAASVNLDANNADLALTKVVDTASPDMGDDVTFTVTVTNNGPDAAVGVTVNDLLPSGLTYVSDDGAGAYNATTGDWTVGTLADGASATLHITATATTVSPVTNTATVTATTHDPAAGDNTATATVDARASDVGITKVADVAKPSLGETITYTITVTSYGPDDATGIVAHDLIPPGMTYTGDDGAGAYDPLTGDWTIGTLASGDSVVLHITVVLDTTEDVVNTASVISSTTDPDSSNDSSSVTTPTRLADLAMDKTVSDTTPNVGDLVTYTLTVTNLGPDDATATTVTDQLPAGLTYISDSGAGAYNPTTGVWSAGTLTLNQSATLDITARVDGHTTITNTATARTTSIDTVSANNADSASLNASDADLDVTKTVSDSSPDLGENVVYTVSVHNSGPDDATGVAVTDLLPAGLTYVSDDAAGDYVSTTGLWTVGDLTSGQTKTLQITATVTTATTVTNTATITGSSLFDPAAANNTSAVAVDARTADVAMSKIVDTATPDVDGNVTYTVTVTNNGPDGATGVVVDDLLPAGATYVSDTGAGAYVPNTGVWTVGSLANGASSSLEITATITTPSVITNTASVTSTSTDTVAGNDTASVDVNAKDADLSLSKTVSDPSPPLGSQVTYTLTLTNTGPDAAASATVTDLLPSGVTYVSDTGAGSYVPATGLWTVGPIASGDSATLDIVATVTTTSTVTNSASITATGTHDPNATNDSASAAMSSVAADLAITKTVSDAAPNLNDTVTFDVTVTNNGPNGATGVRVTDLLPSGLTYVSDTGSGAYVASTGVWTIGALANGASTTLSITARATSVDPVTNTATVSSTTVDPASADNTASAAVDARAADITMTKAVSDTTPTVGDTITYTLTVNNSGPDSATAVTVSDVLPAGVTYVSDTGAGAYSTGTGTWTVGTLAAGATAELQITATIATAGPITNTATASTTTTDPTSSNDEASATLTATSADLDITKTVSDSTPDLGTNVTYTVTVTNAGPDGATGVVVTDQLPAGLTWVSDTGAGAYDHTSGLWTIGSIADGATKTLTITAEVTSLTTITNTATITASSVYDPTSSNDESSVAIDATASDLSVAKSADVATATVGDTVTYTVTARNDGPDDATAVSVSDQLPAGLTWVSDTGAGAYDHTTGAWTIGTLANGATATLTITATITGTGSIANTASIDAPGTDPDDTNDTSTATVTVPSADLSIAKSVSSTTPNVGDTVTYTVVVTNDGPDAANAVTVTDQLPTGLTYVSDNAAGAYNASTGVWSVGTLADGASATLTIDATVDVNTQITNTAAITAADEYDPQSTDNTASVNVDAPQSDLEVTKSVSDSTPNLGSSVTYTLVVTNNGTSPATGVVLHDLMPTGIDVTSTSVAPDGTDVLGDYWNIGSLAVGASRTITITATVTSNASLTNTAIVGGDQFDTDTANNTAQVTTSATSADLVMSKTVSDAAPNLDGTVTYTLTVDNVGPGIVDDVVVTDQLPSGLTYVSSTGTGTYNASTGEWTIGTIANGDAATRTIVARVTTLAPVANTATITTSSLGDPDTSNNSASATVNAVAADLVMSKSVSNAAPTVGDTVTFTLGLTNNGPDGATGIVVADALPAGLVYVADTGGGSYDNTTGEWTVGSLANGATATIDITATVTSDAAIVNTATATSDVVDPTAGNNDASATVNATQADLAITKNVDVQTPDRVGDAVTFTVVVTNNGPDSAAAIEVTDQLPAGLTYVSHTGAGTYTPATGVWALGTLASGASATLTITATIDTVDPVTNTATITGSDQFDPSPANDADSATVNVPQVDLSLTKTVDDASPARIGDSVTYTLTVANAGPDASAPTTTVTDLLPAGLTYVSDDGSGAYNATTGVWQVGSVPNGATRTLHIIATVDSPGTITNTATVSSPNDDPVAGNDTDSVSVTAESSNVAITKTVNFLTPRQGDDVIYTLTVTNNGPDTATGVLVEDQLPAGLTYVSDDGAGAYDSASGVWTVGAVANGASASLQITATATTSDPVTNTATVDADQRDPDTADNTAEASIDATAADVSITKTVDDAKPAIGDTVTYTITATNNGPDAATGVVVNDMFPSGITVLTANPPATGANAFGSFWNVGALTSGDSETIVVTARVDSADPQVNTATVTADQYDTTPANNSASAAISGATADLVVSKLVDEAAPANLGDTVTFTVRVANDGPDEATGVSVADALPSGMTLVSATAPAGTSYAAGVWTIGSLPNGEMRELTVTATIDTLSPVTNTATATANTVDPTPADNTASAQVDVPDTDVRVTKTVNAATPPVGTNVTFTITATNAGPLAATDVSVADVLPANLTLVSANATTGTYAAGVWTIGAMANGAVETLTVVATVTDGAPLTNTATISADQEDGATSNNTASADVDGQVAGIELTKTVDNGTPARIGDQVTYTITLTNNGPDAATGTAVTDQLPAGLTYVSSSATTGTYNAGTGMWSVGTIANGVTETLTITATVDVTTPITNTATATSDLTDPTANIATAVVDIPEADLAITKTVSDTTPAANGVVTYTLAVTNDGPDAATGVVVDESLPTGLTMVDARPSGSTTYTAPTWTIGTLASGATATLEIDARVTDASAITNTATVTSDVIDPASANDSASATVNVPDADLSVTKTVDRTAPLIGDIITYTVTVENAGPDTAPAVAVDDALPAGLTLVSASATAGSYSDPTWTVGSLASGAQATLTVRARVTDSGAITNTATVTSDAADPTTGNDADAVTIDGPDADLSVTKTVDDSTPALNGEVTFTVTVANAGPDTARNVVVTDALPAGLTLVGTPTATAGAYSAASGQWTIAALPSGATETLTMTARVTDPSNITNTATADSDAADANAGNDSNSASVDVPDADIAVTKSVDNATPELGDTVTFTITATNNGPLGARGVVVTDAIPAGLTVASGGVTTTSGTVSGDTWTLGSMANGATETMTVTATVDVASAITNTATVTSTSLDGNTANDSADATVNVPDADLRIRKTVSDESPSLGDTVTYTLTVTNNGPDTARDVVIHDSLPSGLTFVSSTPAMDATPGDWTIGDLADGATATVEIQATVDDTTQITNTATVTSATTDLTPGNGSAVANVDVPEANLSLSKAASDPSPRVGESVTYTITLTNAGPDAASNVDVAENLPAELDLVSATASRGTFSAGTWQLPTVPVGSHTLTIVARPNTEGTTINTAEVTASDTRDPNSTPGDGTGDDIAEASITVRPPLSDLSLSKSVSASAPRVGDTVTYNLRVSNSGPSRATGVTVSDPIPAGYVSATASQGTYDDTTGLWDVGAVSSGSSATLAIRVKITATGSLVNTAEIAASNVADPDSTPGNGASTEDDMASATLTALPAIIPTRLSISKTGPAVVRSGDVFSFTIKIGNTGAATATGVTITDCIPRGVSLVPSGSYVVRNGRLVWRIGNLAPGATRTVRVRFKVDPTSARRIRGCVASVVGANAPVAKDGAWVRIIPKKRVQRSAVTG